MHAWPGLAPFISKRFDLANCKMAQTEETSPPTPTRPRVRYVDAIHCVPFQILFATWPLGVVVSAMMLTKHPVVIHGMTTEENWTLFVLIMGSRPKNQHQVCEIEIIIHYAHTMHIDYVAWLLFLIKCII